MAAACAAVVVLIATSYFGRGSVFCGSTSCYVASVLWSLPSYAALLAMVTTAVLIASALLGARVGPFVVRIVALAAAITGALAYVTASLVSLDTAWTGAFSGQLTPGPPPYLLPRALVPLTPTLWAVAFMLIGVWIALTSLLILPLRAPLPLVVFGWVTGVALTAYIPLVALARDPAVNNYALPAEFFAMSVWALGLGILLVRRPPLTR
jgi:hypothetical protein